MENRAWIAPISPPMAMATATLKHRLAPSGQWFVLVLATKPANALASIIPSMPMLMMPERSHRMPLSAPRIRGTAARRVKLRALIPNNTRSHVRSCRGVRFTKIAMAISARASAIALMEDVFQSRLLGIGGTQGMFPTTRREKPRPPANPLPSSVHGPPQLVLRDETISSCG